LGEGQNPVKLVVEGVELTLRSLCGVLERNGIERVASLGEKFDPRHHEAVRQIPVEQAGADAQPGKVVEVYQEGYLLKGRLLRPALVAVTAGTEA